MTVREAAIILPATHAQTYVEDNGRAHGTQAELQSAYRVHEALKGALLDTFGGVTVHTQNGQGAWRGADGKVWHESVVTFTVAIDDNVHNVYALRGLALNAARTLGQEAVYIRQPSGAVEIIPILSLED